MALAELSRVAQGPVAVTIWPRHPTKGQVLLGEAVKAAGVARPDWLPTLAADNFPPMAWHVAVSSGPVPGAPPHTERVLGTGRSE